MQTGLLAIVLAVLLPGVCLADSSRNRIADVPVLTQENQAARFYTDLIQGHTTVVNFVFTGCSTVCPLMGVRFATLQQRIAAEGLDVKLVSVSLDPANDTPQRLAEWSHKFGAKPGWTLVTGEKTDIDTLTASLGASTSDFTSHAPLMLIIDDAKPGAWQRLDGLAEADTVIQALRQNAGRAGAP